MRILVLVTDAFGGHGGIAKFNRDLLQALCSHPGITEVVAIPRLQSEATGNLPAKLKYVTGGLNSKIRFALTTLQTVLRDSAFNLVLCGHINLLPIAFLARLRTRAPIALVIHGIDAWQPTRSAMTNDLARRVDAFVAVSEVTKERFLTWTGLDVRKGFVLPNCVDLAQFQPGPPNAELLDRYNLRGRRIIMTLARLSADERYKGIDEVMEVLPDLAKAVPDISYLIVGDGTDRGRLEEKAVALGISDRVVFAGRITDEAKQDHYRLADAFVMPGRGEGFGIVYLEAMACGVPVVASKLDASREAVRDGELGILVDPKNADEIRVGICEALRREKGRIQRGLEHFSTENFQARVRPLLDSLVASGL
jgi:glycosyltransferase involved in cell wall biosynthesis